MPYSNGAAAFGIAFAAALLATPLARRLGFAWGLVDHPSERKMHSRIMPRSGGLSVYFAIVLGVQTLWSLGRIPAEAATPLWGIAFGAFIIFAVGVIDDRFGVRVPIKFFGQFLAALVLVLFEVKVSAFIQNNAITTLITIVWIVGVTNAFNLLDNMDGLSTTIAAIAAGAFYVVAVQQDDALVAVLAPAVAGAALGFLPYNWPPGRIFLGDSGSMTFGYLLAATSVQGVYLSHTKLTHLPVLTPLFILSIPLFDTFSVMAIRLARGLPIFRADKNHISHRLHALGLSPRETVCFMAGVAVAIALPTFILPRVTRFEAALLLLHALLLFGMIALLLRAGLRAKYENNEESDRAR